MLVRPVFENLSELTRLQPGIEANLQALKDSLTSDAGRDCGRRIVKNNSAFDFRPDDFATSVKFPWESPASFRVSKQNGFVTVYIFRPRRNTKSLKI
ncbi:hypothetical protein T190_31955 [Sinorhizobium meliloti CCBAU 01290]|nr:hypothetical protein T190_31955 [Sinorhizobium meliloti CCBAU 01290]